MRPGASDIVRDGRLLLAHELKPGHALIYDEKQCPNNSAKCAKCFTHISWHVVSVGDRRYKTGDDVNIARTWFSILFLCLFYRLFLSPITTIYKQSTLSAAARDRHWSTSPTQAKFNANDEFTCIGAVGTFKVLNFASNRWFTGEVNSVEVSDVVKNITVENNNGRNFYCVGASDN